MKPLPSLAAATLAALCLLAAALLFAALAFLPRLLRRNHDA